MSLTTITVGSVAYASYATVAEADAHLAVDLARRMAWADLDPEGKGLRLIAAPGGWTGCGGPGVRQMTRRLPNGRAGGCSMRPATLCLATPSRSGWSKPASCWPGIMPLGG